MKAISSLLERIHINKYTLLFFSIIALALVIRLFPLANDNFHFTMDQGEDAVHVREIINRHQLILQGPETNVQGVFAGPLWYYFISIGYILTGGHPSGGVLVLIALNVVLTGVLMKVISSRLSMRLGLLVGLVITYFWWFYDSSRFSFNPFVLVFLSTMIIIVFSRIFEGKRHLFPLIAIFVGLAFHAEAAGASVLLFFTFVVSLLLLAKKRLFISDFLWPAIILFLFFLPHLYLDFTGQTNQLAAITNYLLHPHADTGSQLTTQIGREFVQIFALSSFPQNSLIGLPISAAILLILFPMRFKRLPRFVRHFVFLSLILFGTSWLFFSIVPGWRNWHTVALRPLLFISIVLVLATIPKQTIAKIALVFIVISQAAFFLNRYTYFLQPLGDASILRNEIAAIDWVYGQSHHEDFSVYIYLPSVRDFPYQYLFWWQGKNKFGYLPCEYSLYLGVSSLFVPGVRHYQNESKDCQAKFRYLIIEPDANQTHIVPWLDTLQDESRLVERTTIGTIVVEKRTPIK